MSKQIAGIVMSFLIISCGGNGLKEEELDISNMLKLKFYEQNFTEVIVEMEGEGVKCTRMVDLSIPGVFRNRKIDSRSRYLISCDLGQYRNLLIYKVYVRAYLFFDEKERLVDVLVVKHPDIG